MAMNMVTPCWRASAASAACTGAGTLTARAFAAGVVAARTGGGLGAGETLRAGTLRVGTLLVGTRTTAATMAAASSRMLIGCCALPRPIGLPEMISCSLPNAMIEPQNEIEPMIAASQADELMVVSAIYDHEARKKSYSLLAEAFGLARKEAA